MTWQNILPCHMENGFGDVQVGFREWMKVCMVIYVITLTFGCSPLHKHTPRNVPFNF
jgi:hypothetical protein